MVRFRVKVRVRARVRARVRVRVRVGFRVSVRVRVRVREVFGKCLGSVLSRVLLGFLLRVCSEGKIYKHFIHSQQNSKWTHSSPLMDHSSPLASKGFRYCWCCRTWPWTIIQRNCLVIHALQL